MSLFIIYSRFKINVIYLRYSSFLFPSSTRVFERQTDALPAILERRAPSVFEVVGLIILSTINQPFSESSGFHGADGSLAKCFCRRLLYRPVFSWSGATRLEDFRVLYIS